MPAVAANLLAQDFVADAPNQRWVGDTTEFVIGSSGKLYLAAILDLYSRFVVGWVVSAINLRERSCRVGAAIPRRSHVRRVARWPAVSDAGGKVASRNSPSACRFRSPPSRNGQWGAWLARLETPATVPSLDGFFELES